MSDRPRFLQRASPLAAPRCALLGAMLGAMLGAPATTRAQTLDEMRARSRSADSVVAVVLLRRRQLNEFGRFDGDGEVRSGGRVVRYLKAQITPGDSSRVAAGLELGRALLASRFGDAGTALIDTATWVITRGRTKQRWIAELYAPRDPTGARVTLPRPISSATVADFVLSQAGDRLTATTPALGSYAGWTAFLPERVPSDEIARRLATSWAATGRRCAVGAVAACKVVLAPFDVAAGFDHYFDASDVRAVVTSARLPGLPDSAFSVARRQCLDGQDSSCARIIYRITPADPFNTFVRGSLIARAIALGGKDALARLAAQPDGPPIAILARVAGVSEDALIESWHAHLFASLTSGVSGAVPAFLTTLVWCGLLLLVSLRRRFL